MNRNCIKFMSGFCLIGSLTTTTAQTTVNYHVTDAGGGNSRVTWTITGSLAESPGAAWAESAPPFAGVFIAASDIFNSNYPGMLVAAAIPTPDGSYFHNTELGQDFAINSYSGSVFGGTNYFGLMNGGATTAAGQHLTYIAGTQSVIIPIPFSDFNIGNYQSFYSAGTFFTTSVTVNLIVGDISPPPALGVSIYSNQPAVFFPTFSGNYHVLQMTTNLTSGNWVTVSNGIPINGFIITNAPGTAFFRLQ